MRRELIKEPKEEEIIQDKQVEEPKVYLKHLCVSQEEMFNIINEKLDLIYSKLVVE